MDGTCIFSDPGTYQVFYFAEDAVTGNISSLAESGVYKAKPGNSPPDPFSLISPEEGATGSCTVIPDWEDATDPDGDGLTYTVLFSKDDDTFSDPICKEGLDYSICIMGPDDGMADLTDYYWKVRAVDEYGAVRESDVRTLHTDTPN